MAITIPPANYQDIDGVLWGWCWEANQANGHTVLTYGFPTSSADYAYTIGGFEAFNADQQAAGHRVIAMYDAVCNLDLVFTTDQGVVNIRLAEASWVDVGTGTKDIITALGCAPDPNFAPYFAQGDTWFNHDDYNTPTLGDFAFAAGLMHEVGHALGLKHGHLPQEVQDASGYVLYTNPALPPDHDFLEYSVMTYRSYPGGSADLVMATDFPSTPMQDDIFALQYLYGANYDHQSGDTVYSFSPTTGEMFIDGVSQGATYRSKIFLTVWDGGGNDTYRFFQLHHRCDCRSQSGRLVDALGGATGRSRSFASGNPFRPRLHRQRSFVHWRRPWLYRECGRRHGQRPHDRK